MNTNYILPMAAMVFLTFCVGLVMLKRRVQAVRNKKIHTDRFKTLSIPDAPEDVLKSERHFINLFEVPVLFYSACIVAMLISLPNYGLVTAWIFVGLRYIQASVHLWPNIVLLRMSVFLLGFAAVSTLWLMIVIKAIS